jgi:linearmycin/streptolysin S transport system ATP-binding protein
MARLLEVTDLKKQYNRLEALKGVSFSVNHGELFGLLGPNGAGKTTLISILSCLMSPTSGQATLDGQAIRVDSGSIRRQIGLVPQDLALYGELTARENLRFFGKLYGMRGDALTRRADELLEAFALTDRANDRVQHFSGGMKRRLNLGVAIMHQPRLLFLDEATTGVDPQSRNRIFEEVRRLNSNGMTIIYTSHYMEEVQALCSRIGILDNGKLIACDTLPNLLNRLEGQIHFRLESIPDSLLEKLKSLPRAKVEQLDRQQFLISTADVPGTLMGLTALLASLGLEPEEFEAHEPNLERVFLHLTGRGLRD